MKKFILPVFLFSLIACNNTIQSNNGNSPIPVSSVNSSSQLPSSSSASVSPMASPLVAAQPIFNARVYSGCGNQRIICAGDQPCAVPTCGPFQTMEIEKPMTIKEEEYDSVKNKFSLFAIEPVKDYLGGLKPAYALAQGLKAGCEENEGLAFNGGRLRSCSSLIVEKSDKNYENINSIDLLKKNFAPVDSAQEAISYVAAATNTEPMFELTFLKEGFRYYQNLISPTSAIVDKDGNYTVNMFTYQKFGCGPHPHYAINYSVSKDGNVKELSRTHIYDDPMQDGLCVD